MVGCLTLEWLALGVWVGGGIVLIGAVIPAVFNTFGGQDSGGLFLTKAFEGYHRFMIGALAILWAALWYRWWSGSSIVAVGNHYYVAASLCGIASSPGVCDARGGGKEGGLRSLVSYAETDSLDLHGRSCIGYSLDRNQGE
jgi:hypothetical protein